jgi:hypothetical protein
MTARIRSMLSLPLAALALAGLAAAHTQLPEARGGACSLTAQAAHQAALRQAQADYALAIGKCLNYANPAVVSACMQQALLDLQEANELAADQLEARLELCADLGEAPYDPVIDPSQFVAGVTNPFYPLVPGRTLVYQKVTSEGLEEVRVTTLSGTRTILGVACTRVSDIVTLDGVLVEVTEDWFAQDLQGNVWYMGEATQEYEDGMLVSLEGSWEAGVDGAKPGILMPAAAVIGLTRRLEFQLGEAEDVATLERVNRTVNVPAGMFKGCRETEDETPLEPDVEEHKFYAPGVGVVLEVNADGERLELVQIL